MIVEILMGLGFLQLIACALGHMVRGCTCSAHDVTYAPKTTGELQTRGSTFSRVSWLATNFFKTS